MALTEQEIRAIVGDEFQRLNDTITASMQIQANAMVRRLIILSVQEEQKNGNDTDPKS